MICKKNIDMYKIRIEINDTIEKESNSIEKGQKKASISRCKKYSIYIENESSKVLIKNR